MGSTLEVNILTQKYGAHLKIIQQMIDTGKIDSILKCASGTCNSWCFTTLWLTKRNKFEHIYCLRTSLIYLL